MKIDQIKVKEILSDKKKLHEIMLVLQSLVIFNQLVIYEYLFQFEPEYAKLTRLVQFLIITVLNVTHASFVRFFMRKYVFYVYTFILFSNFFFFSFGVSSFKVAEIFQNQFLRFILELGIVFFLVQMLVLFIYVLKDSVTAIGYHLMSAANAFIMIPLTFSFIYIFIEIIQPGVLGIQVEYIRNLTQAALQFSCYTIAGIDHLNQNANPLLKNIAAIESIFASLYLVLLVGRIVNK